MTVKNIFVAREIALNLKLVMSFQAWMDETRVRGGCRKRLWGRSLKTWNQWLRLK